MLRICQCSDIEHNRCAAVIIIYLSEQSDLHIKYCLFPNSFEGTVNGKACIIASHSEEENFVVFKDLNYRYEKQILSIGPQQFILEWL